MSKLDLAAALKPIAPTPAQEARIDAHIQAGINLDRWVLRLPDDAEAVRTDFVRISSVSTQPTPTSFPRYYGQDSAVRSFSAPRPFIEAVNATAKARGVSISELVREALLAFGVSADRRPTAT